MTKADLFSIRDKKLEDENFIYGTMLPGIYGGNDYFHQLEESAYYEEFRLLLKKLLTKPELQIQMACLQGDPDVLLGYSIWEKQKDKNILYWVYVKQVWREIGIAKSLLPKPIDVVVFSTKDSKERFKEAAEIF